MQFFALTKKGNNNDESFGRLPVLVVILHDCLGSQLGHHNLEIAVKKYCKPLLALYRIEKAIQEATTNKIIKRKNGKKKKSLIIRLIFFLFLQIKPSFSPLFDWSQLDFSATSVSVLRCL